MDGVGEWATTSAWLGENNQLTPLWQIDFPDSLGLLYSAFTGFCGFKVNSGEYKLMGLAPYGKPVYQSLIEEKLIDIRPDGSFKLNMDYFDYPVGNQMVTKKFAELFGGLARLPESELMDRERNLAASIQAVTEKIVLRLAKTLKKETGACHLCLAGGVALNCVANGKLADSNIFDNIWIQPAAGDAGGALGAALSAWYAYYEAPRIIKRRDEMSGSFLGPDFSNTTIQHFLDQQQAQYTFLSDDELVKKTAKLIDEGHVVGWFQGKMEFGPRALGNRSILADPRKAEMQSRLNLKIKFRESFRPFAPSILEERVQDYFEYEHGILSPYMQLVASLKPHYRQGKAPLLPAVTHVDFSSRVQTVNQKQNPCYYQLLKAFEELTSCPILINTSFNIRGEPMVCTPENAWRCFMYTDMDYLVIGNYLLEKHQQVSKNKQDFLPKQLIMD